MLFRSKEEIERDLGFSPKWQERDKVFSIGVHKKFPDVHGTEYREAIKSFFAENINQFVNVFRPRSERISKGE